MGTFKEGSHGIPQLTGANYENWVFRVKLFLEAKEVAEALDEDEMPKEEDEDYAEFMKKDRRAKPMLVGFIADQCLGIVREKETASAMWKALEDTFVKKSVASQTLLRKQLARLRMKDGVSMLSHFNVFDEVVRQLKSVGAKLEENDLVVQLFLTLPDSYDPLVTALENIGKRDLTLEMIKQRLIGEESKRADRDGELSDGKIAAFVATEGHMVVDCPKEDSSDDEPEEVGAFHTAIGGKAVSFMAGSGDSASCSADVLIFKMDSGSSQHLVNDELVFSSTSELCEPVVIDVAKYGESLEATVEGTGQLDVGASFGKEWNRREVSWKLLRTGGST